MKTIKQLYAERSAALPVGKNGRPDPQTTAHLKWELHYQFWSPVRSIMDPRGSEIDPGSPAELFYNPRVTARACELEQSFKLAKQFFGLRKQLDLGTFIKVRRLLKDLLSKARTESDADIAVCVLVEFLRLELGEEPDPEYGSLPKRENPCDVLDDEECYWDDEIDPMTIDGEWEEHQYWGFSELGMIRWVCAWEEIVNDPAKFENEFPGMAHRRLNVARALQPVFELHWVYDYYPISLAAVSICELLEHEFSETRMRRLQSPSLEEVA
jgi:hypothetical protein